MFSVNWEDNDELRNQNEERNPKPEIRIKRLGIVCRGFFGFAELVLLMKKRENIFFGDSDFVILSTFWFLNSSLFKRFPKFVDEPKESIFICIKEYWNR